MISLVTLCCVKNDYNVKSSDKARCRQFMNLRRAYTSAQKSGLRFLTPPLIWLSSKPVDVRQLLKHLPFCGIR